MSPSDLPPDAILARPTRSEAGWSLEVTCYTCGQQLGNVIYVTEPGSSSYYVETDLVPELVERRSLDPETGWPRFAASARASSRGTGKGRGTETARPDVAGRVQLPRAAGPVIVACPRRTCGKRQGIVPELEWAIATGSGTTTAGSVAWGGSKLAAWYQAQRKANAATREKQPRSPMHPAEAAARADRIRTRRLRRRESLLLQRERLLDELAADPDGSGLYPSARIQVRLVEQWVAELELELGTVDDAEPGERASGR